jgi:hypothetical protein
MNTKIHVINKSYSPFRISWKPQEWILTIRVSVQTAAGATCLASHSKGDILDQKIITHLTERNTLYRATVVTKYVHTHHVSCIITFHFCTFSIMIISSYFLSKYTNNLTIKDILNSRNTFLWLWAPALFNGHCIIQTARRNQNAFVCHLWAANHSHRAGPATVSWAHATYFQAPVRVYSGWWGLLSCANREQRYARPQIRKVSTRLSRDCHVIAPVHRSAFVFHLWDATHIHRAEPATVMFTHATFGAAACFQASISFIRVLLTDRYVTYHCF